MPTCGSAATMGFPSLLRAPATAHAFDPQHGSSDVPALPLAGSCSSGGQTNGRISRRNCPWAHRAISVIRGLVVKLTSVHKTREITRLSARLQGSGSKPKTAYSTGRRPDRRRAAIASLTPHA